MSTCAGHMWASFSCLGHMTSLGVVELWPKDYTWSPVTKKLLSSETVAPHVIITFQCPTHVFRTDHVVMSLSGQKTQGHSWFFKSIYSLFHCSCHHFKIPHVSIQKWCPNLLPQRIDPQDNTVKIGTVSTLVSFLILFPTIYLPQSISEYYAQ